MRVTSIPPGSSLRTSCFSSGWNSPIDPRPILDFFHITINPAVNLASLDLNLERHGQDVGINVLKREGDVEVVVVK